MLHSIKRYLNRLHIDDLEGRLETLYRDKQEAERLRAACKYSLRHVHDNALRQVNHKIWAVKEKLQTAQHRRDELSLLAVVTEPTLNKSETG